VAYRITVFLTSLNILSILGSLVRNIPDCPPLNSSRNFFISQVPNIKLINQLLTSYSTVGRLLRILSSVVVKWLFMLRNMVLYLQQKRWGFLLNLKW